ncbi:MAG: T9SS type A sorting domain-containing protein [Bacteroidetes bacterium]|nr:T9SS type A sorting domain-containing protein [Bacteroidota bacterium]
MTVTSNNACNPATATATYTVNVNPLPTASAGGTATICVNSAATVSGASSSNGTISWAHNGLGSLSNASTLTPTYNPVSGDSGNTVILTMTVTSNNACSPATATATFTVIINPLPTASAGGTATICVNSAATVSGATFSNGTILWTHNGVGSLSNTTTLTPTYTAASGDAGNTVILTMTVTSNNVCNPQALTAQYTVNVTPTPSTSVTITSNETTVCIGTNVTFTAVPINGGTATYTWKVNGNNIGPNLSTFSYTPNNNDVVLVEMTSSLPCALPVTSNTITMNVVSSIIPTLSIVGNNNVCVGSAVSYTATPTNAGNNPIYTWYVNNVVQTGHTTSTFTYTPANNDQVRATVLSSACSGGTANSNTISMTVNPILPTSVSISSATEVCANVEVLYTAIPVNGGVSPVYQWFVNDVSVASPGFQFTYTPLDEDEIVVHMTSSLSCVTSSTVTSPLITMTVDPITPVSVTITSSDPDLQICQNTPVTFTAHPVKGGLSPNFQWKVNNLNVGSNSNSYTYNPVNNDIITVVLTSSEACPSGNPATSNALQMTVTTQLVVGVGLAVSANNICDGQSVTFTATPYNGGSAPMYQWKVGGANIGPLTVSNTFSYTPTNGQQISVAMTSNETCVVNQNVTSDVITMIVNPLVVPSVNVFATNTAVCEGEPMAFSALVTNGGATPAFQWKLDGVNTGPNNPVYSFIPPVGTHTITVQVTSSLACVTSTTVTATPLSFVVNAKLPVSVSIQSNNTTVCAGTAVTFTANTQNPGTTPGFTWKVNGGTVGSSTNTFSYAPANNDQVWVVLSSSETCSSGDPATSTPIVMNVLPTPSVNLSFTQGSSSACVGDSIKMTTVYNLAYLYTWFVDNVQVKTGQGVNANNYAFKLNQTKTVRVEVKLGDCIVENSQTVIANLLPVIQITASDAQICEGDPVTLTLTGISGTTWQWINPDFELNYTPITIYPEIGVQVFSAEATNFFGCVNTATVTVDVIAKPIVDIVAVGGQFACTNAPKSFTATQNPNFTYKWFVNDQLQVGATSHTFSDTLTGVSAVEVKVQATNTITGCFNSDSTLVTPIVSPTLIMTPTNTELCPGEQTFITLSSSTPPPVYYAWGDGLQGNVLTRGFIPTTDTLVWAEAINPTGCITRDTLYISVNPAPVAQINNPAQTIVCEGQTVTLTTSVLPNHQYKWSINGDSVAAGASYTFAALQTRTVVLTVKNQFGCVKTDQIVITVEDAPEVNLGGNRQICTNYLLELAGPNVAGYTYKWFVNNVQIANTTYQYAFIVTQPVTVRLEATVGNCTSADQITVTPLVVPGINLTANNSEICLGDAVNLQVSTTSATSFIWWDGLGGNLTTRSVVPLQADTTIAYWAQAINGIGCTSRDTVLVRVNPLPAVPLTVVGGSNIICFNATATVQGPQLAGYSYQWFIDNVSVGTNSFQHSFVVTKDVVVKLEVTDANGCVNVNQTAIQSRNLPGILLSPDSLEVCLNGSFTLTLNDQNVNSYSWFDGLAGNLKQRTFEANLTGNFIYWVEGVNAFGCVSRDTAYITVHPNPDVEIVLPGGNDTFCEGETIVLSASQTAGLTFEWIVGGVVKATTAVYTFVGVASVDVTLVATDANGCFDTDIVTINVEDAPEVDLGGDRQICTNYLLELSGPANPNYTYQWFVNNQLIGNVTNTYAFVVTQITTVRLVVTAGDCVASDEITVTPLAIPTINVTASDEAICLGESVTLTLSTQNATSFIWWDGLGGNLTQRAVTPLAGDTTIAYWAQAINGIGCTSRDTVLVTVNPLPEVPLAIVGGSNIICFNATAIVQGPQLAGHSYQWFIDEVPVGTNSFVFSFVVTKDVVVKLRVTNINGCVNTNQIAVNVRNLPGILLSPDSLEVCLGGSFTLTLNDQHVNSYSWFDGLAGNLKQRTFAANTAGSFIYWVEGVNSFGCISRDTAFITVHPNPDVYIVEPFGGNRYCQNEAILLEASIPTGLVYNWFVDGVLSGTDSVFSFLTEVSVEITLLVTDENGCQDSDTISINVFDAPEVDLGGDRQICIGYPLTFTAPVDGEFYYEWYVNNVLVSTDSVYSFIVTQNLTLRLYVGTDVGCSDSDEIIITTLASPVINLTPAETAICLGETVQISLTTNGSSFIWWDGLGTNLNTRSFTPTFGDSTYVYWAEAINAIGCKSRDTAFVTVNSHPVIEVSIPGSNTFCYGTQATVLGPVVAGYQYQWYVNNLPAGNGNGSALNFTVYGNSMVRLDVTDANGCIGSDSIQVFMHTAPGILLSPDSLDICIGESFTLSINPVNILAFSWWDGLAGGQLNRTFTPQFADSTYMYWAEGINSIGCISRDTAYITVHSLPKVSIITPFGTSFCQGETVIIQTPPEDNFTYAWYMNDVLVGTEAEITFTAEEDVTVVLMVTNEYGCTQTDEVLISVWETPQIDLGGDRFVCPGVILDLTGPEGESFTYAWYLDGELVGVNTSVFTHIMAGTAVIRLEMNTQNGCAASDEITLTPLIAPGLILTASETEICLGASVVLQASTTNATAFEWWDGSINLNRIVVPPAPGTYYYSATAISIDNCAVTDSLMLIVYPQPVASLQIFQGSPTVCEGSSITFSLAESSGLDVDYVVWNKTVTVPMGTDIIKYYTYAFNESGWFTGEVVTEDGCSSTDSLFITVQPRPLMTISNDTTICAGQTIALKVTGGQSCVWKDINGNIIGAGYTLQVAPNSTRKYFATITDATNFACTSTDSVLVTVLPAPIVIVEASADSVCGGTPIVLTASGANSFVWSTGQTGPTITVVPNATTTYSVIGLNEQGCTTLASIQVVIKPTPVVTLSGLLPLYCLNDTPSVLTGLPVGGIFNGPGVVGGQFRPLVAGTGTHMVIYTYIAANGCIGSDTLTTSVVGVSGTINLGADVAICPHEQITFDAGPGFQKYYWSTGDTTRTTTIKGTAYFPGTTRTITVIGTVQECSVMGTVNLTIRNDCYISIDEIENNEQLVLMPNPSRGEFAIKHNGAEGELFVSVYDGRGVEVFSGSFEDCSDGSSVCRINLSYLPKGIYMVTIRRGDKQFVRKMVLM